MAVSRFIQVGKESAFGTKAPTFTRIRATGFSDSVNRNSVFEEGCDIAAPTYAVAGVYKASGTIDGLLRFSEMQGIIDNVLGATGYLLQGANTQSMSIVIGDDQAADGVGSKIAYVGCGFTSMEFTFAAKEFVKCKYTWIGASADVATTTEAATLDLTSKPALTYNAVVSTGAGAFKCKSVTLKVDRKIDEDFYYIGSPLLQGIYANGMTEISGTITFGANEWDNLKNVISGGKTNSITAPALGTIAASHELSQNELATLALTIDVTTDPNGAARTSRFYIKNLMLNESTHSVQGRNMWEKSVNYKAYVSATSDFTIGA